MNLQAFAHVGIPFAGAGRGLGRGSQRVTFLVLLGALVAGLALMILLITPVTRGGDYGQWLMVARHYLGGSIPEYRDTSILPPLAPLAIAGLWRLLGDPFATLLAFDLALLIALAAGFALLALGLFGRREAGFAAVAIAFLIPDRFRELFAFGGLLQATAIACALLSLGAFVMARRSRGRTAVAWFWAGGLAAVGLGLSHVATAEAEAPVVLATGIWALLRGGRSARLRLAMVAPLAVALVPVSAYWLLVLLPGNQTYADNPASLNYTGPQQLVNALVLYLPNALLVVGGAVAMGIGGWRELRRRVFGPYLWLALWTAAAWGLLALAILKGAGTDYSRFAYLLLPPLVLAAAGGLSSAARALVPRLGPLALRSRGEAALVVMTILATLVAPLAIDNYGVRAKVFVMPDDQAALRAIDGLDLALAGQDSTILVSPPNFGANVEAFTGRPTLTRSPIRYAFRAGQWERSIDATVLLSASLALTNENFLVRWSGPEGGTSQAATGTLTVAANHGGEFVNLLSLAPEDETFTAAASQTLAALPLGLTERHEGPTAVDVVTEWRGPGDQVAFLARTVTLSSGADSMAITEASSAGPTRWLLRVAPGIALASYESTGEQEARLCFSKRGNTNPCVSVAVEGSGARLTEDGKVFTIEGATDGRTTVRITALSAGRSFVGLALRDPAQIVERYAVGAVVLSVNSPQDLAAMPRLTALGFTESFDEGIYRVLLRPLGDRASASVP